VSETAADYGMAGWPFEAVIVGLFVVVMARSHLFYWVGRGVFSGGARLARRALTHQDDLVQPGSAELPASVDADAAGRGSGTSAAGTARSSAPAADAGPARASGRDRAQRLLRTPTARRGLALVHRFGPFAVVLAYLTVGVQTAVFVASGVLRMPYPRFVLASIPGSIAWAFIWGTVGLSAVWAGVRLATASPWALAAVLLAIGALVTWRVVARRRARAGTQTGSDADQAQGAIDDAAPAQRAGARD
jgi:membrane protein DedA with SNARE-associated domain